MKQFQLHIAVVWFALLSITQAKHKRLRKRPAGKSNVNNFHPRRKLDYVYPNRTEPYGRRHGSEKSPNVYIDTPERFKRGSNRTAHEKTFGRKASRGSTLLPQPAKPLRVVATSAVIKNRLKKPRPMKAIHIWGPTPFKTVLQNLQKLNANLQKQRGAVKRLFLPVQLQRMQFLNALRNKPPFPGPMGPISIGPFPHRLGPFNMNGHFPVPPPMHPPDAVHFEEGPPSPPHVLGPMEFGLPPLSVPPDAPVLPLHEMGPMHFPDNPPEPVVPFHEMGPMHFPDNPPEPVVPLHGMGPMHLPDNAFLPVPEVAPDIAPMHEPGPVGPIPDIGPAMRQMVPNTFGMPDMLPNVAPNFEPPHGLFEQPFPFLAGEIHREVNRHVHEGRLNNTQ